MDSVGLKESNVPDLLVRGVDDEIVRALKERAGAHGRSAEAEHRAILAAALAGPRRRTFAQVLASMPERIDSAHHSADPFF
jgi:antitoxin FitA